ncbi:MAG: peptidylprolyl isomerase [Proteobacteria bacterium]|nr:peptidylprolyl isomerase [Pseudomonadota bacterium]
MKIQKNNVVNIKYTLTDDNKKVIDKSQDGNFNFLIGAGNIIPGLENALLDKVAGDVFDVQIAPVDAYGEYNQDFIHKVPRTQFPADIQIEAGMQFQGQSPEGKMTVITIKEVNGDDIMVDNNHPLAGVHLNFAVEITGVREAAKTELEHGHVHDSNEHHG